MARSRADQRVVDEAVLESFPASDAPAFTATHAGAPSPEPLRPGTPRELRGHVLNDLRALAARAGERRDPSSAAPREASRAVDHIASSLLDAGFSVTRLPVPRAHGETLEVVSRAAGRARGDVVIGAHYDVVEGGPGGDATGVAVLLGLARVLGGRRFARTVRLVAFAREPGQRTAGPSPGSVAYAERLRRQGAHVEAMIALDCLGHIGGGTLALIGNIRSRRLVREAADAFRKGTRLPLRPIVLPGFLPLVSPSDHRPFWSQGWRAAVLTDGGPLGSSRSHIGPGVVAVVDPDRMTDVIFGLATTIARLAGDAERPSDVDALGGEPHGLRGARAAWARMRGAAWLRS